MTFEAPTEQASEPWHEMPNRFFARCGSGSALNDTSPSHPGIYQSYPQRRADHLSPFALIAVRRHLVVPPLYDAVLVEPRTGERIDVARTGAVGIADAIYDRCRSPKAPLTRAIYALISDFYWSIDRKEGRL